MRLRCELTVELIKEMLREVLEDFKDDLIEELREGRSAACRRTRAQRSACPDCGGVFTLGAWQDYDQQATQSQEACAGGEVWAFVLTLVFCHADMNFQIGTTLNLK